MKKLSMTALHKQIAATEATLHQAKADFVMQAKTLKEKVISPATLVHALLAGFMIGFFILPRRDKHHQARQDKEAMKYKSGKSHTALPSTKFLTALAQIVKML